MAVTLMPLSEPLGVEVTGIDLSQPLDPEARQGLARLANQEKSSAFSEAMSEALAALERDDLQASLSALKRAEAIEEEFTRQ